MARYNGYNSDNEIKGVASESRNAERVAEANRNISNMRSDILRLKIMLQAMLEVMVEQGVDPDLINSKIEKIMAMPETFEPEIKESKPCPRCGRMVLDNGTTPLTGTCLYCGAVVKFPPKLDFGDKESESQPDEGDII